MLALDISRRLEKNKLNYSALEALIQRLTVGSVGLRADRLKSYMGETNLDKNKKILSQLIQKLILGKDGSVKKFEEFNETINKDVFGIVLTAHPTFGMTTQMMDDLAKLASMTDSDGEKISKSEIKSIIKQIFKTEHRPEKKTRPRLNSS